MRAESARGITRSWMPKAFIVLGLALVGAVVYGIVYRNLLVRISGG